MVWWMIPLAIGAFGKIASRMGSKEQREGEQSQFWDKVGTAGLAVGSVGSMFGAGASAGGATAGGTAASGGAWYDKTLGGMQKISYAQGLLGSITGKGQQSAYSVPSGYSGSPGSDPYKITGYDYGQYMPQYAYGGVPNEGKPAVIYDMASMQPAGTMNEKGPEYIVPAFDGEEGNYSRVRGVISPIGANMDTTQPLQYSKGMYPNIDEYNEYQEGAGLTPGFRPTMPVAGASYPQPVRVTDPSNEMVQEGYAVTRSNPLIAEDVANTEAGMQYAKVALSPDKVMTGLTGQEQSITPQQAGVDGTRIEKREDRNVLERFAPAGTEVKAGLGSENFKNIAYGLMRGLGFYYDMRKARYGLGKSALSRWLDWYEGTQGAETKARGEQYTRETERYKAQTQRAKEERAADKPTEWNVEEIVDPNTGRPTKIWINKTTRQQGGVVGEAYKKPEEIDKKNYQEPKLVEDKESPTGYSYLYVNDADPADYKIVGAAPKPKEGYQALPKEKDEYTASKEYYELREGMKDKEGTQTGGWDSQEWNEAAPRWRTWSEKIKDRPQVSAQAKRDYAEREYKEQVTLGKMAQDYGMNKAQAIKAWDYYMANTKLSKERAVEEVAIQEGLIKPIKKEGLVDKVKRKAEEAYQYITKK